MVSCTPAVAEVAWRPAVPHNDRVLDYFVFYNMTFFDTERDPGPRRSAGPYRRGPSVDGRRLLVRVKLVPGSAYSFHVRARNSLGWSEPSGFSTPICRTPPTVPFRNPAAACTESRLPGQLVITWQVRSGGGTLFRYVTNHPGRLSLQNEYQPKGGDVLRLGTKGRHGVICS